MTRRRILFVFGTRPEAVKLCPLVLAMRRDVRFEPRVCVTAQHREMLDQVLSLFGVPADRDLDVMTPRQSLTDVTTRVLSGLEAALADERPDLVVVQGDTTTTFAASLAAFYAGIPVAHVEAGLRTGDIRRPFPEEMNRVLTSRLASLHFAPTPRAADALVREGVPAADVFVSGNTVIDALRQTASGEAPAVEGFVRDTRVPLVVVEVHRRESFGEPMRAICRAVRRLAERGGVQVAFPVHRNPEVDGPAREILSRVSGVALLAPLEYRPFVHLLTQARLVLTDSGGIQEEAPSLGVPVLVLREVTERPEAVEAGTVRLVGADEATILREASRLLDDPAEHATMARAVNPYGDGRACERIVDFLLWRWGAADRAPAAFAAAG